MTEDRATPPQLPLVSVIVVNYNYGRYLAQAVASVLGQDYPRVECIVVDNASTDESRALLAEIGARQPELQVVLRDVNGGQTAAALEGLAHANGPYVVFLDADDYLLPHCVSTHMRVHLSTRLHVGFTSADMLQIVGDDQVVVTTNEPSATYLRSGQRMEKDVLRPTRAGLGALWDGWEPDLASHVHHVSPRQKHWVWSPTSGMCFRRDALDLVCDAPDLATLRSQTDLFLAFGINAICGSLLIDEPLFAYRLHGSNVFSARPQLAGQLAYDPRRTADNTALARRLLVDQMVGQIERFVPQRGLAFPFLRALHDVDARGPDGRSYALAAVARRRERVAEAVGPWLALGFLVVKGAPPRDLLATLRLALRGSRKTTR